MASAVADLELRAYAPPKKQRGAPFKTTIRCKGPSMGLHGSLGEGGLSGILPIKTRVVLVEEQRRDRPA